MPALVLFSASATALFAEEPAAETIEARYRMPALIMCTSCEWPEESELQGEMAEFVKANGFNCVEANLEMLELCRENGLYARVGGDLEAMLSAAPELQDDPAVFCYFISDRQRASAFPGFAQIRQAFEEADPNHPTQFINRAAWNEFYQFAEQVDPMLLDFYHYHWSRYPERRYIYLAQFRELSQERGIPVMRCVSSSDSPEQLRQTIYTSLAYGVQGFHFWVPWLFSVNRHEDGSSVVEDGELSARCNVPALAEIAQEIQPLGPVLLGARSVGAYHTPPVHPEAPGASGIPEDFWAQLTGEQILMGVFEDEDNQYLLIVNCDASSERQTTLTLTRELEAIERMNKSTGEWESAGAASEEGQTTLDISLPAGSGDLFRLQ